MKNTKSDSKTYQIINLLFAGIIGLVFLYSGFFAISGNKPVVPSGYTEITGKSSISTGLSRGFVQMISGNPEEAKLLNQYTPRIFYFFVVQFTLRICIILSIRFLPFPPPKYAIAYDIVFSTGIFIYCFFPFFEAIVYSFG